MSTPSAPLTYWDWLGAFNGNIRLVGIRGIAHTLATISVGLALGFRLVVLAGSVFGRLVLPKIVFVIPTFLTGGLFFVVGGYLFFRLHWLLGLPLALLTAYLCGGMFIGDIQSLW